MEQGYGRPEEKAWRTQRSLDTPPSVVDNTIMSSTIRIPEFRHASFLPMEVEAITNIKSATIRDWRRRGFIRPRDGQGWQRFELGEVAELLILRTLSEQGIGPQRVGAWLPAMASHVTQHAMASEAAWETIDGYQAWCEDLAERIRTPLAVTPKRYGIILPAPGGIHTVDDLNSFYQQLIPEASAVTIVLDLKVLGDNLRIRAQRPIASVEWWEGQEV